MEFVRIYKDFLWPNATDDDLRAVQQLVQQPDVQKYLQTLIAARKAS